MSIATDIVLILVCVAIILKHTIRGFAKTVLGVVAFVGAMVVSWIFTPIIFGNSSFLVRSIANILIFLTVYVVLTVVFSVVNKIFKLPILGAINTFLGFAFGAVCAYILGSFVSSILSVIVFLADSMSDIGNSFMYKFFSEYGAFSIIEKLFIK